MIIIKTEEEIEKIRQAGLIVAKTHEKLKELIKPGITTMELDKFVHDFQVGLGARPAQLGYQGFPHTICASLDDVICHGFPTEEVLKEGSLLKVDMVVELDGYMADSAWAYAVGEVSDEVKQLMKVTKECLFLGMEAVKPGARIGDIGHAIQKHAESFGYSVVKEFVGHGIGQEMHEAPQIPHYGEAGRGKRLEEGMVFTIEPMINTGGWKSKIDDDGWTARTADGSLSCQYEHTLAVTSDGYEILTEL